MLQADEEVPTLGQDLALSTAVEEMLGGKDVLDYFLVAPPPPKHLHIIVQPPSCKSSNRSHALFRSSGSSHPLTESLIPFSMQYPRQVKSMIDYLKMMPTASLLPNEKKDHVILGLMSSVSCHIHSVHSQRN